MPTAATTTEDSRSKFGRKLPTRLHDEAFYKVCEDQKGEIMFERLITAIIMVVAVAIGAGSGALGFVNHTIVF